MAKIKNLKNFITIVKLIMTLIVVMIIVPFGINFIFLALEYIPGTMYGTNETWISFLGGYIGAILTLGGVWYQIKIYRTQELDRVNAIESKENEKINKITQNCYLILIYEIGSYHRKLEQIKVLLSGTKGEIEEVKKEFSKIFFEDRYQLTNFKIDNFYEIVLRSDIEEQHNLVRKYSTSRNYLCGINNMLINLEKMKDIKEKNQIVKIIEGGIFKLEERRKTCEDDLKKYQNLKFL